MIRVFHINAGDCGACAAEIWAAVEGASQLTWATTPQEADVVALSGSIPPPARQATLTLIRSFVGRRLPIVVVGRCAIDGYPFGKGGVAGQMEIEARRKIDGCPPLVDLIVEALVEAARKPRLVES
jgi:Ni,Fe-hydrogenase III small subunit